MRADAALPLEELRHHFAAGAAAVDRGELSTRAALRHLGALGLLDLGQQGPLGDMVEVVATVAHECLSSAFSVWAQHMVLEFLKVAEPGVGDLAADLASGQEAGATAMASAFAEAAGVAPLPVTFTEHGDGLRLDGTLRWVSNLFDDGFWVVLAARSAHGDERVVVVLPSSSPGLTVGDGPDLLALGSTSSASLRLDDVAVAPEQVVSRDLGDFLARVRRPFLCLQAAFCVGLTRAALDAVAARPHGGLGQFDIDRADLEAGLTTVTAALDALAADDRRRGAAAPVGPLLTMRLEAARLAWAAVALEVKVTGGAAYLSASPTARRLREAAFLPIQSPTEAQLRLELASCAS